MHPPSPEVRVRAREASLARGAGLGNAENRQPRNRRVSARRRRRERHRQGRPRRRAAKPSCLTAPDSDPRGGGVVFGRGRAAPAIWRTFGEQLERTSRASPGNGRGDEVGDRKKGCMHPTSPEVRGRPKLASGPGGRRAVGGLSGRGRSRPRAGVGVRGLGRARPRRSATPGGREDARGARGYRATRDVMVWRLMSWVM